MAVQPAQQLSMDPVTQRGFIQHFKSLPEKPSTTVRIFDRNDYYTVHGEDAVYAANEVFHTNSVIKYLGSGTGQLPSVILSKPNFESFVRDLLLVKQYRVEIFGCKIKSSNDWKVIYKASPGNLHQLEDVLFGSLDMSSSSTMLAIKLATENNQQILGCAYADPSSEVLGVAEFFENDQFSNLEALIIQLKPKECLLGSDSNSQKLRQTLQKCGVLITERKRSDFSATDICQDLGRLLSEGESASSLAEIDLKHAMCCLSAVIKYLELLSDEANFGVYKLSTFNFSQYLRLDNAAVEALNVEAQAGDSNTSHLMGILNHTASPQGKRLLHQWLRQPLLDKNKIEERLDLVEIFFHDLSVRRTVQDYLKLVPDYFWLAKKIRKGKGSLQDCVRVYQSVSKLPMLVAALTAHEGPNSSLLEVLFINPLKEACEDFSKFVDLVEETVDMNLNENHEYVIKPSFDTELSDLKEQMDKIESKIKVEHKKASKELDLEMHKAIKLEFTSQLGHFFRITKKSEKCLRAHKQYRILDAHKDGVRFNTAVVEGLNEEYMSLRREYSAAQASLVQKVLEIAAGYTEPMLSLNHVLAKLDVLISFAHASAVAPLPYVKPVILPKGEGDILLKGCRHPCMEIQDSISFIANDVSLLRNKENFQIITGPNMGGKSTYMRQAGVTVLMAQVGCFVACSSASICVVDSILARVGAGDSQLKGISTFMAEMMETSSILKAATADSLVIIDELGRGTSTYDGFGLAWAISEYIATEIKCFCLFATHFHELTQLADQVPTVINLHVTALTSDNSFTLLYQVKPGACDRSFGLHVAELAEFPPHVIEFAKAKVKELEIWNHTSTTGCDELQAPPAKHTKLESDEGERIISAFLASVKKLASSDVSDSSLQVKFEELKSEFLQSDNSYVKYILQSVL